MNRYTTPVQFAFVKNLVTVSCRVVFGANGVAILDTNNSKGVCAFNQETVAFTGATTNSSTSVGTVSSFNGLYPGMSVVGSTGSLQAGVTISSVSGVAKTVVLSSQAILTGGVNTLFATGGRYRVQFGYQAAVNLDGYYRVLSVQKTHFLDTASTSGTALTSALTPGTSDMMIVQNNIGVRTIPGTSTSGSTDCSLAIQLGDGVNSGFTALSPQPGEVMHFTFQLVNSSAP